MQASSSSSSSQQVAVWPPLSPHSPCPAAAGGGGGGGARLLHSVSSSEVPAGLLAAAWQGWCGVVVVVVRCRHNERERERESSALHLGGGERGVRTAQHSSSSPSQAKPSHATVSWPPAGAGLSKGGVTVVGWLVSWLLVASHFKEN